MSLIQLENNNFEVHLRLPWVLQYLQTVHEIHLLTCPVETRKGCLLPVQIGIHLKANHPTLCSMHHQIDQVQLKKCHTQTYSPQSRQCHHTLD